MVDLQRYRFILHQLTLRFRNLAICFEKDYVLSTKLMIETLIVVAGNKLIQITLQLIVYSKRIDVRRVIYIGLLDHCSVQNKVMVIT
jgi:hypothetical protein